VVCITAAPFFSFLPPSPPFIVGEAYVCPCPAHTTHSVSISSFLVSIASPMSRSMTRLPPTPRSSRLPSPPPTTSSPAAPSPPPSRRRPNGVPSQQRRRIGCRKSSPQNSLRLHRRRHHRRLLDHKDGAGHRDRGGFVASNDGGHAACCCIGVVRRPASNAMASRTVAHAAAAWAFSATSTTSTTVAGPPVQMADSRDGVPRVADFGQVLALVVGRWSVLRDGRAAGPMSLKEPRYRALDGGEGGGCAYAASDAATRVFTVRAFLSL